MGVATPGSLANRSQGNNKHLTCHPQYGGDAKTNTNQSMFREVLPLLSETWEMRARSRLIIMQVNCFQDALWRKMAERRSLNSPCRWDRASFCYQIKRKCPNRGDARQVLLLISSRPHRVTSVADYFTWEYRKRSVSNTKKDAQRTFTATLTKIYILTPQKKVIKLIPLPKQQATERSTDSRLVGSSGWERMGFWSGLAGHNKDGSWLAG